MTSLDVDALFESEKFPFNDKVCKIIETHISWVILTENYAFKIKKPISYSFLDFSSLDKRKYYCHQEVKLNRRLASDMYIGVVPVISSDGHLAISSNCNGNVLDYAVMMHRMNEAQQMHYLLEKGDVSTEDIKRIAEVLVKFHQHTEIISQSSLSDLHHYFDDLLEEKSFVSKSLSKKAGKIIERSVSKADSYIQQNSALFEKRTDEGFVRDCHGDLHSRNIFLCEEPVIFDCIEFNSQIRQIDLLNELAFFCMDLEASGYKKLSDEFMTYYNCHFPVMRNDEEQKLFVFFKAYRANVRAKVNALRAKSASEKEIPEFLEESFRYLKLMENYVKALI